MSLHFHHFYVFTSPGAPAVDKLASFGLVEGPPNVHPGQGTANRRIFFANGMVEFIWIQNSSEAQSEATRRTRLFERSESVRSGFSPYGICVTADDLANVKDQFRGWSYRPGYLPPGFEIWMANNEMYPQEPAVFLLNIPEGYSRPASSKNSLAIKRIEIAVPHLSSVSSDAIKKLSQLSIFRFDDSPTFKAKIEVEGGINNGLVDLTAWCPLEIEFSGA